MRGVMCSACVARVSFVQIQTAMGSTVQPKKLGGRLVTDAFSFVTAKSSGLSVVAYRVMRNASLPSASTLVPVVLRGIWY